MDQLKELHYQFTLANQLDYIKKNEIIEYEQKILETEKVLNGLIRALRKTLQSKTLQPKSLNYFL